MGDVEVNVSGHMEMPNLSDKSGLFNLPGQLQISAPAAKEWLGQRRQNVRPWTTFINSSNFKVPPSLPRLSKRIIRNIEYFQSNYLFVFIGLIFYCLLTSPWLLVAVAVSLGFAYHLSKREGERKLTILGKEVSLAQQYGVVAVCSIPLFIWAGAGAAVFWVLGASMVIIRTRASELYRAYLKTAGLALMLFIVLLQTVVIDYLFFFCLYYIGASFLIIALHAAFFNIESVVKDEDSFGLLEEV